MCVAHDTGTESVLDAVLQPLVHVHVRIIHKTCSVYTINAERPPTRMSQGSFRDHRPRSTTNSVRTSYT
jgi:hypothetical protein